jgi:hypothetical protein
VLADLGRALTIRRRFERAGDAGQPLQAFGSRPARTVDRSGRHEAEAERRDRADQQASQEQEERVLGDRSRHGSREVRGLVPDVEHGNAEKQCPERADAHAGDSLAERGTTNRFDRRGAVRKRRGKIRP